MKRGFTLIEIMVVFAILAVLIIMGLNSYRNQINKARDADRKGDLHRIQIALEDYYNDHNCYPPENLMDKCGENDPGNLKPYLEKIPCDPITKQPYPYAPDPATCFKNFRVLTHLDNLADPIATDLSSYCTGIDCNYGVSSTNLDLLPSASALPSASPAASASPSPSPSPSPSIDYYACRPPNPMIPGDLGACTYRGPAEPAGCDYFWQDINCEGFDCTNSTYQCPE